MLLHLDISGLPYLFYYADGLLCGLTELGYGEKELVILPQKKSLLEMYIYNINQNNFRIVKTDHEIMDEGVIVDHRQTFFLIGAKVKSQGKEMEGNFKFDLDKKDLKPISPLKEFKNGSKVMDAFLVNDALIPNQNF